MDGVFDACKYFISLGYEIIIITNQSGIGRGYYTQNDFLDLTNWMINEFDKNGVKILKVYFCPHSPTQECDCRKPKIGMIENILKNHSLDLKNSWLIGDKSSDIKCAYNAKIGNTIQVKSGHSFDEKSSIADFVCKSIKESVNKIIPFS